MKDSKYSIYKLTNISENYNFYFFMPKNDLLTASTTQVITLNDN